MTWKGISADWLIDVFCQTPFIQRLIEFHCDCWFVRDVCFIEFLRRNGKQGALVDHVTMFDDLCVEPPLKKQRTAPPTTLSTRSAETDDVNKEKSTLMTDLHQTVSEKAEVFVSYTGRYKFRFFVESLQAVSYTHLTLPTICSV